MEENTYNQQQQTQSWQAPETNWEQIIRDHIKSTRGWLMFMGVLQIVYAGLYTIITFGIGIILMWVPFMLGLFLIRAANRAKAYLEMGDIADLADYHKQMKNFFLGTGIMVIVALALTVLLLIVIAVVGLSFMNTNMIKGVGF